MYQKLQNHRLWSKLHLLQITAITITIFLLQRCTDEQAGKRIHTIIYIYIYILFIEYRCPHIHRLNFTEVSCTKKMFSRLGLTQRHSITSQKTWILLKHYIVMFNVYRTSVDQTLCSSYTGESVHFDALTWTLGDCLQLGHWFI